MRGARVTDAGLLADGRFALVLRQRGESRLLAVDVFASPPLVTVETGELGLLPEPGFVRAAAAALKGTALAGVRARRGDRLLRLTFTSRSRFGVDDAIELYLELVPRFGNLVLTKRGTVVAAAKEFSPAQNAKRSVRAGHPYELPPLADGGPRLPKGLEGDDVLAFAESDASMREPLFVYRRAGTLLQAHLLPLPDFAEAERTREDSLLAVFSELHRQLRGRGEKERSQRRRDAVLKRLREREHKLQEELIAIALRRERAAQRDGLRTEGERIFAELYAMPAAEREDAKIEAAALFARYKKLGASLPHLDRRERELRAQLVVSENLAWEAERVAPEDVDELEGAIAALGNHRAPQPKPAVRRRRRALLEIRTASGSRIVVGRSPVENAHVTFTLARPDDLWFHAQGIPGAHVILARDDRSDPPPEDIATAAALAALHSKAKSSAKVPVDYTLRKHVRKQRNAPPGLVWYTNPKTIAAVPDAAAAPKDEALPNAQLTRRGRELQT